MSEKFRIQTLNSIASEGLARFPAARYDVGAEVADAHAILLRSQNIHEMEFSSNLHAVGRAGAGVNNIPVDRLGELGIPVFNAPGANANAVKELVIAGILLAARNLAAAWDYVRNLEGDENEIARAVEAGKKQFIGFELPGRTLGVIGLGAIGVEVSNAALELGMNVVGYDPKITVRRAWQLSSGVAQADNLEDVCSRADMITCHVPFNDRTKGLLNREMLALLKPGATVLNFARKGIIDEDALIKGLDSGAIGAYVTDFPSLPLLRHERAICLPHLGASTHEAEQNCAVMVADNIRDFLENGNIRHSVNFPEAVLRRTRPHRLAISNANVPNMVGQVSTALAEEDINIADLLNVSRGQIAHTIVDLDGPASDETLQRIRAIDGILSLRVLPIVD